MALPEFSMRQLLEAGVHFGHNTRRWNPKMEQYIFGIRNGIHIIDLQQTVPMLHRAMTVVRDTVKGGGRVLFVGTKRQATNRVAEAAARCGQYYVNHRWLGGMMTNWQTISNSIKRLRTLDEQLAGETEGLTKKETLGLTREREKLDRALGGIKEMGGLPDILVVIDTNKESIAIAEANKLGIPVVGIIDSNSNPDGINYPIPGNDDAIRAIGLYCDLMVGSVFDGLQAEITGTGGDIGAAEEVPAEILPETPAAEPVAADAKVDVAAEAEPAAAAPAATEEAPAATEEAPAATEEAPATTEETPSDDTAAAETGTDTGTDTADSSSESEDAAKAPA